MKLQILSETFHWAAMHVWHVTSGYLTSGVCVEIRVSGDYASDVLAVVEYTYDEIKDRLGAKEPHECDESRRGACARQWAVESLGLEVLRPDTRYGRARYGRHAA